jgi:putative transposase
MFADEPEQQFRRRNLPHWEVRGATYFLTFRLAGSLPHQIATLWQEERTRLMEMRCDLTSHSERQHRSRALHAKFDEQLDTSSSGAHFLNDPRVAKVVSDSLQFFDGDRYELFAYCIMPNHVHVLWRPLTKPDGTRWRLDELCKSIKGFSGRSANALLGRSGEFWQREYYDHLIRDRDELAWYFDYTRNNPVTAGFCSTSEGWPWTYTADAVRSVHLEP